MSLIWDIIQHSQISKQQQRTLTLEERVTQLEDELQRTQKNLLDLLHAMEKKLGADLDGDGKVG